MVLTSVDLPAPLSPTRATTSPAWTSKSMSLSACTAPKRFETPDSDRTAVVAGERVAVMSVLQVVPGGAGDSAGGLSRCGPVACRTRRATAGYAVRPWVGRPRRHAPPTGDGSAQACRGARGSERAGADVGDLVDVVLDDGVLDGVLGDRDRVEDRRRHTL